MCVWATADQYYTIMTTKLFDREWFLRKTIKLLRKAGMSERADDISLRHKISLVYKEEFHRKMHWHNPKTLSEKLIWLAYYWRDPIKARLADKYLMRDYVTKEKGLPADILVPLLGVWEKAEDIDYDALPDSFVLKCNHGCGYNILIPNKRLIDREKVNKQLNTWLNEYYEGGVSEFHYMDIHRHLILAEPWLGNPDSGIPPADIKIHVCNGRPCWIVYCFDRVDGQAKYGTFTPGWVQAYTVKGETKSDVPRPKALEKMLEYATILGKDFPFVRVDFYEVDSVPYLGELTFTPLGNMDTEYKDEYDRKFGDMLTL